jgi:hypothetical protein
MPCFGRYTTKRGTWKQSRYKAGIFMADPAVSTGFAVAAKAGAQFLAVILLLLIQLRIARPAASIGSATGNRGC